MKNGEIRILAKVIKANKYHWIIKCPYCKQKHYHSKVTGYRVPHCHPIDKPDYWVYKDYVSQKEN